MSATRPGIRSIQDVAERNLCLGCGTCAYMQPDDIRMVDDLDAGRRPIVQIGSGPPSTEEALRPRLERRLGLTIAVFCAGTPSYRGTLEMIREMGVADPHQVDSVRYRGQGWPGNATVTVRDQSAAQEPSSYEMSYEESWGRILQKHRQWRCYVCADHTGEFADIAVGDPWYREIEPEEAGHSLVLVRTARGREILHRAIAAGALQVRQVDACLVPASQPNLRRTRGAVWGRIAATRAVGVPAPRFRNMPLFPSWWNRLTRKEKAQSIYGTLKRVVTKRLYRRRRVRPHVP
jgi:coenzyme F420 hydrogenase subunit beta